MTTDVPLNWLEDAKARVQSAPFGLVVEEIGRVESAADGVAILSGLMTATLGELLQF